MDYDKIIDDLKNTAAAIERRYGQHPEADAVMAGVAAIQELRAKLPVKKQTN